MIHARLELATFRGDSLECEANVITNYTIEPCDLLKSKISCNIFL